ncbi:unnamed protein product [Schistosoma curassoni]|uniref:Peptidase S1 domain-containing protein n=1 Tax=Schistosoma curassoni TaxID=6186 RepID=A0A183KT45_9TREM|nr:unnamed protein product [Schistosoma curassoni]
MFRQNIKNFTTILRHSNLMCIQVYAGKILLRSCEDVHKFGRYLSCGKFYPCSSYVLRNDKCSKCGKIGYIQAVRITNIHLVADNPKLCNFDPTELNVSKLSYSGQIHCVILPCIRCSHDSFISNEIISKYVVGVSSAPNPDQNSDVTLYDVVFPNKILVKYEGQFLNKLNSDYSSDGVSSDVICPHNRLIYDDISNECDKYVPNESDSGHISDVIVSDFGYSHNQCIIIHKQLVDT